LTESQMLCASALNPSYVNGIWVWGNATLEPLPPVTVWAQEPFFSQIKAINPSLYDPNLPLTGCSIVVINDWDTLSTLHKEALKKGPVQWYWNDCAYTSNKNKGLKGLWSNLFHAH
ncbi:MAG: hypothetical protein ACHP6H_06290, partial [Legionellales bacterium]